MQISDVNGFGRIEVKTLDLPDFVKNPSGTYTYSGKVLVDYKRDIDPDVPGYLHLAVVNDDGKDFRDIFSGVIVPHPKANGIRFMPFQDNSRVLLGDYVLECSPNIDHCAEAVLVPVAYTPEIVDDANIMMHWSEVIIAPDNAHIVWTALCYHGGAVNYIGILEREETQYVVRNVRIISNTHEFVDDPIHPGYLIPQVARGGEVKQFTYGGIAISLAGSAGAPLPDSVEQSLLTDEITPITHMPGYEETTIISPDGHLGIVMSSRGSPMTNCAILGLMPRPHGHLVVQGLTMHVYLYAVAGVRRFRQGNIGPVLIDITRSRSETNYMGVQLNDPNDEWVYYSPMSWHPNGIKALWPEKLRGGGRGRIRIAHLLDYQPGKPVPPRQTPDDIPYAIQVGRESQADMGRDVEGKIAGKHSGFITYSRRERGLGLLREGNTRAEYVNFSDDGQVFYDGFEQLVCSPEAANRYEARLVMRGTQAGEMNLRLTFNAKGEEQPTSVMFDTAHDGLPESYGYASYGGVTLRVEDMAE